MCLVAGVWPDFVINWTQGGLSLVWATIAVPTQFFFTILVVFWRQIKTILASLVVAALLFVILHDFTEWRAILTSLNSVWPSLTPLRLNDWKWRFDIIVFPKSCLMTKIFQYISPNVRFIWKIIHISRYEKTHYKYIEMRFFVFWDMDKFLDETSINPDKIWITLMSRINVHEHLIYLCQFFQHARSYSRLHVYYFFETAKCFNCENSDKQQLLRSFSVAKCSNHQ